MPFLQQHILLICALGFLAIVGFLIVSEMGPKARLRRRAQRYTKQKNKKKQGVSAEEEARLTLRRKQEQQSSPLLDKIMHPLPRIESLENKLQRAGSKMGAKQFMFRCLLVMMLIAMTFSLLGKPFLLGLFMGFILAVWLPVKYLGSKITKQQKKFLQVFPDAIDLIVRGLRSGLPVSESIVLVSTEVPEPVAGVFTNLSHTMKLGVPMEKALQDIAKKLNYTEFNFFVTSIILQRETGGNLGEILSNLGEVLRKRYMMRMKIKAMTSEARASSIIIGVLPFIVTGAVSIMSPDYIRPLIEDHRGNIAAGIAATMLLGGIWSMNRMAKFEI